MERDGDGGDEGVSDLARIKPRVLNDDRHVTLDDARVAGADGYGREVSEID